MSDKKDIWIRKVTEKSGTFNKAEHKATQGKTPLIKKETKVIKKLQHRNPNR